jgi:RNA polymerase sigma-70 factor (ECF subfamily)
MTMMTPAAIVTPLTPALVGMRIETATAPGDDAIQQLTTGLAAGDDRAFRDFHAAYFDRLLRYLIVVTHGDEQAARDALQETLTRVARHGRRFEDKDVFWSWLTVLARSAAMDGGRKNQRYWRLITRYALSWMIPVSTSAVDDPPDEHLHKLLTCELEHLGDLDRALIEGRYFRGAGLGQLAQETQLTERAVESRLRRARQQLREQLLKHLKNEKAS